MPRKKEVVLPETPHTSKLRQRVLKLREIQNVTDWMLAEEMGLSRQSATAFMAGKTGLNYEHGKRLEGFLSDQEDD